MRRLYLQYLNLRVWFLRRRLRQMGFREVADRATAETLLRSQMDTTDEQKLFLDCVKIALTAVAIVSMWIIFGLRSLEPIQIVVPPYDHQQPQHLSPHPDTSQTQILNL